MSLLIGFLAGVFGGIAGVGGGAVMIPMMVGILKLSHHRASGTSLVTLVFTGIAGTIAYAAQGYVDFFAALLLAATAIFGARAGARFSHSSARGETPPVLRRFSHLHRSLHGPETVASPRVKPPRRLGERSSFCSPQEFSPGFSRASWEAAAGPCRSRPWCCWPASASMRPRERPFSS